MSEDGGMGLDCGSVRNEGGNVLRSAIKTSPRETIMDSSVTHSSYMHSAGGSLSVAIILFIARMIFKFPLVFTILGIAAAILLMGFIWYKLHRRNAKQQRRANSDAVSL